jgi:hypothetical protein
VKEAGLAVSLGCVAVKEVRQDVRLGYWWWRLDWM